MIAAAEYRFRTINFSGKLPNSYKGTSPMTGPEEVGNGERERKVKIGIGESRQSTKIAQGPKMKESRMNNETAYTGVQPDPSAAGVKALKVIVVDDDKMICDVITEFLGNEGYLVRVADSGEEAIRLFDEEISDIAIVDLKLKGINGLRTMELIAAMSPSTVFIIMTGFPTLDASIAALKMGATDFVLKPFKLEEIGLSVKKAAREWKMKKELNRLRERVSQLEASVEARKGTIKINTQVGAVAGSHSHSAGSGAKMTPKKDET